MTSGLNKVSASATPGLGTSKKHRHSPSPEVFHTPSAIPINGGGRPDTKTIKLSLSFNEGNESYVTPLNGEDFEGFTEVSHGRGKQKTTANATKFEDNMDTAPAPSNPPPLLKPYIYITFALLSKTFIHHDLATKICNAFFKHIGDRCKEKSENHQMTFGIKPYLLNKAQQFLNQSNGLPSMKIVTNTKDQPKTKGNKTINKGKPEPKKTVYSKGVVDTNGANEIQFKEMFNFNLNNITEFKPIHNKKRNNSGKAILTFSTCVPPLKIHGKDQEKDQEKEINPLLLNPTRCNACQLHGHHTTKCRSNKIRCTFCSGAHASRDCHVEFHYWPYICFHCIKNPNLNSNHSANHPMCPTWIKYKQGINEQNNVIEQEWEQEWEQRKNENSHFMTP